MPEPGQHSERDFSAHALASPIDELLRDILRDRKVAMADIRQDQQGPALERHSIENILEEERGHIESNLHLLRATQGHVGQSLRELINQGTTPEALHFQKIYEWSVRVASQETVSLDEVITTKPPDILIEVQQDPELLYERLCFLEKYPKTERADYTNVLAARTAEALRMKEQKPKWLSMVDEAFPQEKPEQAVDALLNQVGFIPTELLTKQKFKSLGGQRVVGVLEALRDLEHTGLAEAALHERAKLINHLFISKNANGLRRRGEQNITLDANGLFINLKGFHSHLPYGLTSPEAAFALRQDNWINPQETTEVELRYCTENGYLVQADKLADQQVIDTAEEFGHGSMNVAGATAALRIDLAQLNPFIQACIDKSISIPDRLLENIAGQGLPGQLFTLLKLAEKFSVEATNRDALDHRAATHQGYDTAKTRNAYAARSRVLNNPRYYNVVKMARYVLRFNLGGDPQNKFFIFHSQYKKSKQGDQHSFLEIFYQDKVARVLVNEDKQLGVKERKKFASIPFFDRDKYNSLEIALTTFENFSSIVKELHAAELRDLPMDRVRDLQPSIEYGIHFLLTHATKRYLAAADAYNRWLESPSWGPLTVLIGFFKEAREEYAKFLYSGIGTAQDFTEKFSPEVQVRDVAYGSSFVNEANEKVTSNGIDGELSIAAAPVRVVTIDYRLNDPTQTIPFHIEESCLDALRVDRQRPLINVIGGCKNAGSEREDPLRFFSGAVMNVAHKYRANVCVPGTQSGIGTAFGRQNIDYRNQFGYLPWRDQAHMIAISPGGNTYYPGNPYLEQEHVEHNYAMTPVDSIITPVPAGWGVSGVAKRNTPYRTHIAYMEALYQRMSLNQPQVMVVGNGGLYSIMEINESLSRGFDLFLVKNSGRFAEVASALLDSGSTPITEPETILEMLHRTVNPDVLQEFLRKDFGDSPEPTSDDYVVYREFFFEFLKLAYAHRDRVRTVSLDGLEQELDQYLAAKKTANEKIAAPLT